LKKKERKKKHRVKEVRIQCGAKERNKEYNKKNNKINRNKTKEKEKQCVKVKTFKAPHD
jgi:hypothetical protein